MKATKTECPVCERPFASTDDRILGHMEAYHMLNEHPDEYGEFFGDEVEELLEKVRQLEKQGEL